MARFLLLLRGVNVGASRKLPMAPLRAALAEAGYGDVATFIQSGNILLTAAEDDPATVETAVERLIADRFGLSTVAIARDRAGFAAHLATCPWDDAVPKLLHLCLAKRPLAADWQTRLTDRAAEGERFAPAGPGAFWIDFAEGVARSRLTPAMIDRAAGSTVTARNLNSVRTLATMLGE